MNIENLVDRFMSYLDEGSIEHADIAAYFLLKYNLRTHLNLLQLCRAYDVFIHYLKHNRINFKYSKISLKLASDVVIDTVIKDYYYRFFPRARNLPYRIVREGIVSYLEKRSDKEHPA